MDGDDTTMTDESDARHDWLDMIYRSRALVDEWAELKALGDDALRYC